MCDVNELTKAEAVKKKRKRFFTNKILYLVSIYLFV